MKASNKKLTPQLRFKEFKNSGEWEEKKIKDVIEYEQPTNYIMESNYYTSQGIPVLTANKSFILGYTDEMKGIYNNVPVIIFDDFTTDKKYVPFPFKIKSSAIKILSSKKDYNIKFIYELMTSISFNPQEHKRHYIGTYQNISILVPPHQEQQKIADFLSSVDELIELEQLKLKNLKEYKKGLLQNLFPKENQKVPDIRFKEFKNSGDWDEKKLGKLTLDINERNKSNLTKVLSVTNTYGIVEQEDFFQKTVASEDLSNYKVIRKGDIAYNPSRINIGSVDLLQNYDIGIMSPMYVIVRCKEDILNNKFLEQWLISGEFYSLLERNLQGGVRKSLPYNLFKDINILIPSLKEQQKIADFLSSVDELIELEQLKLEKLKEYKKGLLQQMFFIQI